MNLLIFMVNAEMSLSRDVTKLIPQSRNMSSTSTNIIYTSSQAICNIKLSVLDHVQNPITIKKLRI